MTTKPQALTFFGEPLRPSGIVDRHYDARVAGAYVEIVDESCFYTRRELRWHAVFDGLHERSANPRTALRTLEQRVRERVRRDVILCGWELDES